MLALMWLGFVLQNINILEGCSGAIVPLRPEGLKGVLLSPFLHGNLEHILGNSLAVAALMFLLFQFYPFIARRVLVIGWLAAGLLVWLLPPVDVFTGSWRYSCIIGASGVVYVLAFFLFFSGVFRWNTRLLTVSLVVALYYGSLIWGIFPEELFYKPEEASRISWQSHLAGAVVGCVLAFIFKNIGEKKKMYIWEFPNYYSEKDDKLWQEYRENHPDDFLELPQKQKDKIWEHLDDIRRNS